MLQPGGCRRARELWAIGTPYPDEPVATVIVASGRPLGLGRPAVPRSRPRGRGGRRPAGRRPPARRVAALPRRAVARAGRDRAAGPRRAGAGLREPGGHCRGHRRRAARGRPEPGRHAQSGRAAGRRQYRARLAGLPAEESAPFTPALDEVLSPLAHPRYSCPGCSSRRRRAGGAAGRWPAAAGHRGVAAAVVYHAVPAVLGANAKLPGLRRRVERAGEPRRDAVHRVTRGRRLLAAQRGDDPFA